MNSSIRIRPAQRQDFDEIWDIFRAIVSQGDTYAFSPDTTREQAKSVWFAEGTRTSVAVDADRIVGTYVLKPNQPGLGSHVANAAFMVAPMFQGNGIGERMCLHALAEAKIHGYRAMQFNFVVSTNRRAVELWKRLGFSIVGTSPESFRHARHGWVDVYVMHRFLKD